MIVQLYRPAQRPDSICTQGPYRAAAYTLGRLRCPSRSVYRGLLRCTDRPGGLSSYRTRDTGPPPEPRFASAAWGPQRHQPTHGPPGAGAGRRYRPAAHTALFQRRACSPHSGRFHLWTSSALGASRWRCAGAAPVVGTMPSVSRAWTQPCGSGITQVRRFAFARHSVAPVGMPRERHQPPSAPRPGAAAPIPVGLGYQGHRVASRRCGSRDRAGPSPRFIASPRGRASLATAIGQCPGACLTEPQCGRADSATHARAQPDVHLVMLPGDRGSARRSTPRPQCGRVTRLRGPTRDRSWWNGAARVLNPQASGLWPHPAGSQPPAHGQ